MVVDVMCVYGWLCTNNYTCCECVLVSSYLLFECAAVVNVALCMCFFYFVCVWRGAIRIRVSRQCCDTIWAEAHKAVATHHTPDVSHAHIHTHSHTHRVSYDSSLEKRYVAHR